MSSNGNAHTTDQFRNGGGYDQSEISDLENRTKIPYPRNEIKVEKRPGKRTAAAFCSFRAAKAKASVASANRSKVNSISECDDKSDFGCDLPSNSSVASSLLHLSCDSDHSDTLSFVSDISELSMLSDMRCDQQLRLPIVGVHRKGTSQVTITPNIRGQLKRLTEKLEMVKSENDEYQKQALFVSGHRQELFELKSRNFGLQRQNANLQSQLTSAQQVSDSLRAAVQQLQEKRNEQAISVPTDVLCKSDCKSKLRQAHDEIFRLKSELTERKLEIKRTSDEVTRLRNTCVTLETTWNDATRGFETATRSRNASEQALKILQSEKESFVKSRDWYRDQMHAAQDVRSSLQRELVTVQRDSSATIERLQLELARSRVEVDEERVRSLKEKDELKRQLEDLVIVEKDRLVQSSSNTKSDQDQVGRCTEEVSRMSDIVRSLKSELVLTSAKLQDKSTVIVKLRGELSHLQEVNSSLQAKSDESQLRLSEVEACLLSKESLIENLKLQLCELRSSSDLDQDRLKTEVNLLCQNLENIKRGEDLAKLELEGQLKNVQDDFANLQEEHRSLLKDCEDSTIENLSKILELENLNKNVVQQLRSKEQALEQQTQLSRKTAERELVLVGDKKKLEKHLEDLQISNQELQLKSSQLEQQFQNQNQSIQKCEHQNYSSLEEAISEHLSPDGDVTDRALYDVTARTQSEKIVQLQTLLEDRSNSLDILQRKNSDLLQQLETARCRIENLGKLEDDDLRVLQTRKMGRLECSLASAEAEIQHLSSTIVELEEQVLKLEQDNGHLVIEAQQNQALKTQICQLQDDLKQDTDLRRELLAAIEVARSSLMNELVDVEANLALEKENHSKTSQQLLTVQQQMALADESRKSKKIDTATMTSPVLDDQVPFQSDAITATNIEGLLSEHECAKMTIAKLEDQVRELERKLEEFKSDSESQLQVTKGRSERLELELVETRGHCKALRSEILDLTKKTDQLSDEKNSYRSQVQDMNTALKTSLEHIRRLRTRASVVNYRLSPPFVSSTTTPATSPLPPPLSPTHSLDEMLLADLLNSKPALNKNLSNLQNCLASLKSEMVVLQSKLAPSASSPSHRPRKTKTSSTETSPRKYTQPS